MVLSQDFPKLYIILSINGSNHFFYVKFFLRLKSWLTARIGMKRRLQNSRERVARHRLRKQLEDLRSDLRVSTAPTGKVTKNSDRTMLIEFESRAGKLIGYLAFDQWGSPFYWHATTTKLDAAKPQFQGLDSKISIVRQALT